MHFGLGGQEVSLSASIAAINSRRLRASFVFRSSASLDGQLLSGELNLLPELADRHLAERADEGGPGITGEAVRAGRIRWIPSGSVVRSGLRGSRDVIFRVFEKIQPDTVYSA